MARSISVFRAFLLLTIIQIVVSLSLASRTSAALAISLGSLTLTAVAADNAYDAADPRECKEGDDTCNNSEANPEQTQTKDNIITHEELALHVGNTAEGGSPQIWLSILGKVYDVSTGTDFYGFGKGGYKFYAGRDASPCFSSGTNTIEGAAESMEGWEDKTVIPVYEWSEFYADHDTYKYLGILAGSLYYDEDGNELEYRKVLVARASEAQRIMEEERAEKKRQRMADRIAKKKAREEKK